MKTTLEWIQSFTSVDEDPKSFATGMTLTGSKVERIETVGGLVSQVMTGRILSVEPHPNADRLVYCQVKTGGQTLQIVTGATNVHPGAIVPVALDGAVLADGTVIRTGELRGVRSEGMLCSIDELGFTPDDFPEADPDGIFLLPPETPLDRDIRSVLHLDDVVIDFEITSNRVDCFSVEGLGREAAVTFNLTFKPLKSTVQALENTPSEQHASIEILAPELCYRYCGRVIRDVKIEPSPAWMRRRLRGSGVRPINNLVDITNYVMLELGQPMHAFDLDQLAGNMIRVRRAQAGETMRTLDGVDRQLDTDMLVIADRDRAVALAGVMGAENSEVTGQTTAVLLESATFEPVSVRRAAKKVGLRTEASSRFEKGLDANQAARAMDRACELIEQIGAGRVCRSMIDVWPVKKEPVRIPCSAAGINGILGTELTESWISSCFSQLGIQIDLENDACIAQIPSWRPDLLCEADLAEEAARVFGYNNIRPSLLSGKQTTPGGLSRNQAIHEKIKQMMLSAGFYEICTYSFESPRQMDKMRVPKDHLLRRQVIISNPLGEDYSRMRTSMVPSLLTVAATNWNRSVDSAAVFESASVYQPDQWPLVDLPDEVRHLTALQYIDSDVDQGPAIFFKMKGLLGEMMRHLGIQSFEVVAGEPSPWFHPSRCGDILVNGTTIGELGEIHPDVAKAFSAPPRSVLLDLKLDPLIAAAADQRKADPLPRYPAVTRDLALLVRTSVTARELDAIIRGAAGPLLRSVELFDVYTGEQVESGYQSMAYKLVFRSDDQTLTEADITPIIDQILGSLQQAAGAKLRA